MKHRRLKVLRVSSDLLIQIIGARICPDDRFRIVAEGLPADAEIVNARMNDAFGYVELVVASEEFPMLKPGELMSHFTVTYTQTLIPIK